MPKHDGLTSVNAAKQAKVDPETIRRAVKRGRLKASYTPGGHLRIDRQDLARLMSGRR